MLSRDEWMNDVVSHNSAQGGYTDTTGANDVPCNKIQYERLSL